MSESNKKGRRVKKNDTSHEDKVKRGNVIMGLVMLFLMVFAVAGWAMMSGGGYTTTNENGESNIAEYPLQQVQSQDGRYFWYAIRNYEQFIFEEVASYDADTQTQNLATQIKAMDNVQIYADSSFNSEDSKFLLEKALKGIQKEYSYVNSANCDAGVLILTSNSTYSGSCAIFESLNNESYAKADALVYHLIKE